MRVISRIAYNYYRSIDQLSALLKGSLNKSRTKTFALVFRCNRHWSKSHQLKLRMSEQFNS